MENSGCKQAGEIEILAPAGSKESLAAAVNAGADAVYIGGSLFGARAYAKNLDTKEMLEAIDYVHLHGKKLYLAVNTLLKQEEMGGPLYHYLKPYYEGGLDAVIVQDAGVLEFVGREFPGLAIHASTQMALTMAEGAMGLAGHGVTRLVCSRELGLGEIARISRSTDLEIEAFVHGALCYCYSGQCLMSSLFGGRSGNRGRCAQPCRMEYGRKDAGLPGSMDTGCPGRGGTKGNASGHFLLSPKDICTLGMVPQLIEAGIHSFKIEGRMKGPEYTAATARAYRREVDRYLEMGAGRYAAFHRGHPQVLRDTIVELQDIYNRGGFSDGYYRTYNGREMMSMERPNHQGVFAAKVAGTKKNRAVLLAAVKLHPQDILEIRMQDGGHYEFTLKEGCAPGESLEVNFTPGLPVKKGDGVFRTRNQELLLGLSKEYVGKGAKIPVTGCFQAVPGHKAFLSLTAQGRTVVVEGETVQRAQKQPLSMEQLENQLEKTGDTPFSFTKLEIRCGDGVFIPVSKLNELRRAGLEQLSAAIVGAAKRGGQEDKTPWQEGAGPGMVSGGPVSVQAGQGDAGPALHPEIAASVMTMGQLDAALKCRGVTRIYYDLAALPLEGAAGYADEAKRAGKKFLLRLPQVCRADTYDWLAAKKVELLSEQFDGYLVRNYEELYLLAGSWKKETEGKEKIADAMLYVMNREAKRFFYGCGLTGFTAPYEENKEELGCLGLGDMEITVYGRLPLMTSVQCVEKNTTGCRQGGRGGYGMPDTKNPAALVDRKKKELPVKCFCRFCYNTIYNPECLFLLDSLEEIRLLGPRALRFDFTFESGRETFEILEHAKKQPGGSYTRGHFRRGVL